MKIERWIRESNLIENVDDPKADQASQKAWHRFRKRSKLTEEAILVLHKEIIEGLDPKIAGRYRRHDVKIVGSPRPFPYWQDVKELMGDWMKDWGRKRLKNPDEFKNAHIAFEDIHPFADGNGRTGRMVMQYQRSKAGFAPLLILCSERRDYYSWFEDTDVITGEALQNFLVNKVKG